MGRVVWVVCIVIPIGTAAMIVSVRNPAVHVFQDQASVVTFVTLIAVSIERTLEFLWTVIGSSKLGGYWPFSLIVERVTELEMRTDDLLRVPFASVQAALETASKDTQQAKETVLAITQKLDEFEPIRKRLDVRLAEAKKLAPGSTRVALVSGIAADAQTFLTDAVGVASGFTKQAKQAVDKVGDAINIATRVIASFEDNPARRIASLSLGTFFGMVTAGTLGLNLFVAVLAGTNGKATAELHFGLAGSWGVMLTGVIIGLGSNPTHEIIKALQNYKKSRQTTQAATLTADAPTTATLAENPSPNTLASEDYDLSLTGFNAVPTRRFAPMEVLSARRKILVPLRSTD